mmetsp:Transcript_9949/g.16595  ORF Transcript_9949/g.16595 Transcript_9949/m.16595 type:complete len:233 (+) Transcript_9949:471-1169(+)
MGANLSRRAAHDALSDESASSGSDRRGSCTRVDCSNARTDIVVWRLPAFCLWPSDAVGSDAAAGCDWRLSRRLASRHPSAGLRLVWQFFHTRPHHAPFRVDHRSVARQRQQLARTAWHSAACQASGRVWLGARRHRRGRLRLGHDSRPHLCRCRCMGAALGGGRRRPRRARAGGRPHPRSYPAERADGIRCGRYARARVGDGACGRGRGLMRCNATKCMKRVIVKTLSRSLV